MRKASKASREQPTSPGLGPLLASSVGPGMEPGLLARLVEHAPVAIAVVTGEDHRVILANASYRSLSGAPDEVLGRRFIDAFPDLSSKERFDLFRQVYETGRSVRLDEFRLCEEPSGKISWWDVDHVPYLGGDGAVQGVLILAIDVSDRVRERTGADQARKSLDVMLESITDAFVSIDRDSRFTYVNGTAEHLLGRSRDELLGHSIAQFFPDYDGSNVSHVMQQVMAESQQARCEEYSSTLGRWLECRFYPTEQGLSVFFTDTTERRRAAESLRESESRFRTLAEALPTIVWSATAEGAIDYVNRRWTDYTGQKGGHGWAWTAFLHPQEDEAVIRAWRQSLASGMDYEIEHRMRRRDGEFRWHLTRAVPLRGADGAILKWIGTQIDVHEQKTTAEELARHREHLEELVRERTAELEASYQRLRQSERMASLGTLSAGLGHDMGNLLLPLRVRLDAMEKRGLPEMFHDDVQAIRTSAEYLQRLTNGLRLLALDPEKPGMAGDDTALDELWSDIEPLLKNALPKGVGLVWAGGGGLKVCLARHRLTQALFNLVQNAGEAMAEQGQGTVTIGAVPGEEGRALLSVVDTGPGMTPDVRRRCLEPFFSTKPRDISTGMGLALVRGIVLNAQGRIAVDSQPGQGACFTLDLPLARRGDGVRKPVALVSLPDPRIGTYVASVLRSMAWDVQFGDQPGNDADLWVVADPAMPAPSAAHPRVVAVAPSAKPSDIRNMLRQAVQEVAP